MRDSTPTKLREHAETCKRLAADSHDLAMIRVLETSASEYEAEAVRLENLKDD